MRNARAFAALALICLCLAAPAAAQPKPVPTGADPFMAALLGAIPLASGFYITSSPQKGLAFTAGDAMLLMAIWQVRRQESYSDRDARLYYYSMAAVNIADAVLSVWQVRTDMAKRLAIHIQPSSEPGLVLSWRF